jgi:hypothetical protein
MWQSVRRVADCSIPVAIFTASDHVLFPQRGHAEDRPGETFQQWEARRSGVAVISKKEARRRRGVSARAFDLRFRKVTA